MRTLYLFILFLFPLSITFAEDCNIHFTHAFVVKYQNWSSIDDGLKSFKIGSTEENILNRKTALLYMHGDESKTLEGVFIGSRNDHWLIKSGDGVVHEIAVKDISRFKYSKYVSSEIMSEFAQKYGIWSGIRDGLETFKLRTTEDIILNRKVALLFFDEGEGKILEGVFVGTLDGKWLIKNSNGDIVEVAIRDIYSFLYSKYPSMASTREFVEKYGGWAGIRDGLDNFRLRSTEEAILNRKTAVQYIHFGDDETVEGVFVGSSDKNWKLLTSDGSVVEVAIRDIQSFFYDNYIPMNVQNQFLQKYGGWSGIRDGLDELKIATTERVMLNKKTAIVYFEKGEGQILEGTFNGSTDKKWKIVREDGKAFEIPVRDIEYIRYLEQ